MIQSEKCLEIPLFQLSNCFLDRRWLVLESSAEERKGEIELSVFIFPSPTIQKKDVWRDRIGGKGLDFGVISPAGDE